MACYFIREFKGIQMGYEITQEFDKRFVKKLNELQKKYGTEILEADGIGPKSLDIQAFHNKFFSDTKLVDVTVDGNSNVDNNTVLSFEQEQGKGLHRLYGYHSLWKQIVSNSNGNIKRANKALESCVAGPLKVHDLHLINKSYCYAFSLDEIVLKGLPFINRIKIGPPKHLSSFINLTIQFIAYASNQIAGAVALPDFFVYFDYFARKDYGDSYLEKEETQKIIKQELQSLIWSMNFEFRACQSAFTNLSMFDEYFMKDLFVKTVYPDNSFPNYNSIKKLQEFYMRWFVEISKEQTFTFPINTVNFYCDNGEIKDQKFLDLVSELNCYNGIFNIFTGPLGVLSTCCRLRSESGKAGYQNSLGAGGVSIGSHRVVTLNLANIAYSSNNNDDFIKKLENYVYQAHDLLDAHYEIILNNIKLNKLPLYFYSFMHLTRQFSTIGFIALNECCEIMGMDITTNEGTEFAKTILNKINSINETLSKKDGRIRNLEQIPGESAAVAFAKKDKLIFNSPYKIYSNQYIPLWKNVDIHERIRLQGIFDSMCSGGAICHLNVSDSLTPNQMKTLIETATSEGCIYYSVNMMICRCKTCGKLYIGKFEKSLCHDAPMTYYTRVVGFLTPVDSWIEARREEYNARQFYTKDTF